ncbi:unnamed protein product [Rhizophagus irregularis]|nr:unnamed protein product [Rhizophagus irregularis]
MQNVNMSQKKKFFSFAIKFKEFTLEEVTIPAHILGHLYYNKTFSNLYKHHSEAICCTPYLTMSQNRLGNWDISNRIGIDSEKI